MTPEQALNRFNIHAKNIEPVNTGFIHQTYRVKADEGDFILQKMSPIFKPELMEDIIAVSSHLKKYGLATMEFIKTGDKTYIVPEEETFWRLYTFIPGAVFEEIKDPALAYEAGILLGAYHRILNTDFDYQFKHFRPMKHNIPAVYEKYQKVIAGNTNKDIAEFIPTINLMITLDLPKGLRKTVTHGDPKITNFIFSENAPRKALAMVDWDDVGRSFTPLYELGSAFRSWCAVFDGKKTYFSLKRFEAAFRGYAEGSQKFLLEKELAHIPQAIEIQSLQLASRFVRDYFEGSYFRYDPKRFSSHKVHSLFRIRECLDLYHEIEEKKDELLEIIKKIAK